MKYQVSDKVYIVHHGNFGEEYCTSMSITKVTPSGMVDIKYSETYTRRFNKNGVEVGNGCSDSMYRRDHLDTLPYEERTELLAQEARIKSAVASILQIKPENVNKRWSKDTLQNEIARLRALLNEAHAAVEAI